MALATRRTPTVEIIRRGHRRPLWGALAPFVRPQPLGTVGAAVIVLMVLAAVFADVIAPYDAYEINQSLQFHPPSLAHWFGTDEFGRDVFTRLVYGARMALLSGFAASFLGATAGAIVGVLSAYFGGKTDLVVQRGHGYYAGFSPTRPRPSDCRGPGALDSESHRGNCATHHPAYRPHRALQCPGCEGKRLRRSSAQCRGVLCARDRHPEDPGRHRSGRV